jgi:hypothetical protein
MIINLLVFSEKISLELISNIAMNAGSIALVLGTIPGTLYKTN